MSNKQRRFIEELKCLLEAGRGTESVTLFCEGAALGVYPDDDSLEQWLYEGLGRQGTRNLVTLFALSPCAFCRRGLEACAECDRHGHFDYEEVCEACLGLGVCRCDFCNGSGLSSIETVPLALRVAVALERAGAALQQIDSLSRELSTDPAKANPRDLLREQSGLILRLNGHIGTLENELGENRDAPWWTPLPPAEISRIVEDWPRVCRRAEERVCAAFQSMSLTAEGMATEAVEGSPAKSLALSRAAFFKRFTTPEKLDRTDIDHPILDRILHGLG